jgi:streptomycin 6-kinase
LRSHPTVAAEYVEIKRSLAAAHDGATLESRERYSLSKTEFVNSVLEQALSAGFPCVERPQALGHYLEKWSLCDAAPLAQTETSHLYKVKVDHRDAVLKVLTKNGKADERSGAIALLLFDGHGAVRLLRSDDEAQLLEYVPGPDLSELVKTGHDDEATEEIANVISRLHSVSPQEKPEGLIPLDRRFRSLFEKAKYDEGIGARTIYVKAAHIARVLLDQPPSVRVLHGDIHHENVRHSARGWIAIDPKGLWGERTYDAANTVCNQVSVPGVVHDEDRLFRVAGALANCLKIDRDRLLRFVFVHAALWAAWSLEDRQDPTHALKMATILDSHVSL